MQTNLQHTYKVDVSNKVASEWKYSAGVSNKVKIEKKHFVFLLLW